ncbi:MAG: FecR domain-containing protein [Polyangiales bacterium]
MARDDLEPVKALEPSWNDLREQRLLQRIQEEKRARLLEKKKPRTVWIAAAAAAVLVASGTFAYSKLHHAPAPIASTTAVPDASKMMLADGSEAVLSPDARVQIEEQGEEQVRIAQTAGNVRYDVVPNPKRKFAVKVGDVTVNVLGTAFSVALKDQKVTVVVERGHVEVDAPDAEGGTRKTELHVGESLQVAAYLPKDLPSPSTSAVVEKKAAVPTIDQLLAKADEARAAHRYDEAATALRTLIQLYPSDPRVASASFTLGRVERARGRHAAAAEAFARCYKAAPHGALAEDAMAEEAISWKSAGDTNKAKAAAKRYLGSHPSGAHAPRMIPLAE